jgi:hypothetical protein
MVFHKSGNVKNVPNGRYLMSINWFMQTVIPLALHTRCLTVSDEKQYDPT